MFIISLSYMKQPLNCAEERKAATLRLSKTRKLKASAICKRNEVEAIDEKKVLAKPELNAKNLFSFSFTRHCVLALLVVLLKGNINFVFLLILN